MHRRHLIQAASAASLGWLTSRAHAQADTTLRLVVPYAPGGSSDRAARLVADKLGPKLGQTVVVENRTGAGGRLAAQQLKNAPASQNVLMLANPAIMVVAPLVFKDNGYDADKDFQPVSQVSDYEFGLAVAQAVPVKQLSHLLAWLRANPAQANFGVPATGSLPHFFALMMGEKAHIDAQVVGLPRETMLSLIAIGTPARRGSFSPAVRRASTSRAVARAPSSSTKRNALSFGFKAWIRSKHAWVSSTDVISPAASRSASSRAVFFNNSLITPPPESAGPGTYHPEPREPRREPHRGQGWR